MKNALILISMSFSLSLAVHAQTSPANRSKTTSAAAFDEGVSSRGVRVSLLKPTLDFDVKLSGRGRSNSGKESFDNATGASVGYVYLPVGQLGFTTGVAHVSVTEGGSSAGLTRLEGNLAYAFTSKVNAKGGLNLSKFTSAPNSMLTDLETGLGAQAGLGLQMTRNLGIDLMYSQMNQSGNTQGVKIETKESGLEIGLNATF